MSHQPSPRRRNGAATTEDGHPTSSNGLPGVPSSPATPCTASSGGQSMCHGLHRAACNLGPGDPHRRPVEQKKEGVGSVVSPGCQARKQQTTALISSSNSHLDLIPTRAKPTDALPLQRSRTSLPNPSGPFHPSLRYRYSMHASFHYARHHARNNNILEPTSLCVSAQTRARPILLSPNTWDGPASDQRARTLLPSPRDPFPDPPPLPQAHPMAVITMIRMTLKTPSSRLQGRALLPGGQGGLQKH